MKQWGVDPKYLSSDLVKRFDVRADDDPRLMPHHQFQGLPEIGYSGLFANLLKGIPVLLNTEYRNVKEEIKYRKMLIYTGPIDKYFDYDLERLKYRGQLRYHTYYPNQHLYQTHAQINNPSIEDGAYIRTIEWKYMMKCVDSKRVIGTLIIREFPFTPTKSENFEYPFPDEMNKLLYLKYRERADRISNLLVCGRLGEYRYYDMDQAIGRAFKLVHAKILSNTK